MVKTSSKNFLLYVISFVAIVGAVLAISYALFTYLRTSTTSATINSGTLKMRYRENDNSINIEDLSPMSDEDALNSDYNYYEFYVDYEVNGDAKITYGIYIDDQTDTLDEVINGEFAEIPSKMIKFALDDVSNNIIAVNPIYYSEVMSNTYVENVGHLLYTREVSGKSTDTFRIYMWLPLEDEDGNEINTSDLGSSTFSFFVNVKAITSSRDNS